MRHGGQGCIVAFLWYRRDKYWDIILNALGRWRSFSMVPSIANTETKRVGISDIEFFILLATDPSSREASPRQATHRLTQTFFSADPAEKRVSCPSGSYWIGDQTLICD